METLGDALPKMMAHVRDEIMPAYQACGAAGAFALAMMCADLDAAARAMVAGDTVEMMRLYQSLASYKL